MGKERTRSWKYVFLHLACFGGVLLILDGCISYPEKRGMETSLANAGRYLSSEDFQSALNENDKISKTPNTLGTQALFQRGLIYAHPNNPERDYEKANGCFRKLLEQSPDGEPASQAKVLILLVSRLMDMERQTNLLEKTVARQKTNIEEQKKIVRRLNGDSKKHLTTIEELQLQLNALKDQIEKLKNIDLQIEKVKRQAAPPVKPFQ